MTREPDPPVPDSPSPDAPATTWIGANRCFGALFGDPAIGALFGTRATLDAMLAFEIALTRALVGTGAVDRSAGEAALSAMDGFSPDLGAIERAALHDGLPVPSFVRQLTTHVTNAAGEAAARALHVGATSQDLLDTGLAVALREASDVLEGRLAAVAEALDELAVRWGDEPLTGRTRMQAALPITAGHRVQAWRTPLGGHLARLADLRPRVERVQYGGPVGTRREPANAANAVADAIADALGLQRAARAWHTDRAGIVEYGQWLALVAGSLGKMGRDMALMAQMGEIALAGGGTSSAMAHKRNPVAAELLEGQARFAAGLAGTLHHAALHEQERSGAAWAIEWMALPPLAETCGAMLVHANRLVRSVERIGEGAGGPG